MRFIKQPYTYSCGPTSIINAAKYFGLKFSVKKHHKLIADLCKSSYKYGTDELPLTSALKTVFSDSIKQKVRKRPSYASVIGHLRQNDCAVIMLYWWKLHDYHVKKNPDAIEGHYVMMYMDKDKNIVCINDSASDTKRIITVEDLKKRCRFSRSTVSAFPRAWFLRK